MPTKSRYTANLTGFETRSKKQKQKLRNFKQRWEDISGDISIVFSQDNIPFVLSVNGTE